MICLTVKPTASGSAYGLSIAIQNCGLAAGPSLCGALTFKSMGTNRYLWVNVALGAFGILALLTSFWLLAIDGKYSTNKLNAALKDVDTVEEKETDEDPQIFVDYKEFKDKTI